jgi:hypothetical protein
MISGARPEKLSLYRLVGASKAFFSSPGVLFGSRVFLVLRWTMSGMILGDVASQCGLGG